MTSTIPRFLKHPQKFRRLTELLCCKNPGRVIEEPLIFSEDEQLRDVFDETDFCRASDRKPTAFSDIFSKRTPDGGIIRNIAAYSVKIFSAQLKT